MSGMADRRKKPPKSSRADKGSYFQFRLSELEKQAFTDAASADGKTLSGWIRDRLRRLAREELRGLGRADPFVP
jgi:hypothetical protein